MAQRDYILREIERFAAMIAALRRRIMGQPPAEARADLDNFAASAGLDPSVLRVLSAETLERMIGDRAGIDPTRCWLWAEFLYLDGLTAESEGDGAAARDRFEKALMLYGLLGSPLTGGPLAEVPARIAELQQRLAADDSL